MKGNKTEYLKIAREISSIVKILHNQEKDKEGKHLAASTEPYYGSNLDKPQENLDTLARLFTGNETCAAVCYNDDTLLIASNREFPKCAKDYTMLLRDYINNPFQANYQNLLTKAKQSVSFSIEEFFKKGKSTSVQQKAENSNNVTCLNLLKIVASGDVDLVISNSINIINNPKTDIDDAARDLAIELIRPIIDIRIIANAIIKRDNGLSNKVLEAIKQNKIIFLNNHWQKHAEIRVFDELFDDIKTLKPGEYFIGIAKLACFPCNTLLKLLEPYCIKVVFGGTHGGTYPPWMAPDLIIYDNDLKNEFLKILQATPAKYWKEKETVPYLDKAIPDEPTLAQYKDVEEAKKLLENYKEKIQEESVKFEELNNKLKKVITNQEQTKLQLVEAKDISSDSISQLQKLEFQLKGTIQNLTLLREQIKLDNQDLEELNNKETLDEIKKFVGNKNKKLLTDTNAKLRGKDNAEKKQILLNAYKNKLCITENEERAKNLQIEYETLVETIKESVKRQSLGDKGYHTKQLNEYNQIIETLIKNRSILQNQKTEIQKRYNKLKNDLKNIGFSIYEEKENIEESKEPTNIEISKQTLRIEKNKTQNSNEWYDSNKIDHLLKYYTNQDLVEILATADSIDQLKERLGIVKEYNNKQIVIPLNVNVINKTFYQADNNHWVGIIICDNVGIYVDPTGQDIHDSIKNTLASFKIIDIKQPLYNNGIQFLRVETKQGQDNDGKKIEIKVLTEESNQNDCGAFLVFLLALASRYKDIALDVSLNQESESSKALGQKLRAYLESKNDFQTIFDEVVKIVNNNFVLGGSEEYKANQNIDWVNSYFGKYTIDGLDNILNLRLTDLKLTNIKTLQGVFIDQTHNNIINLLSQILDSSESKFLIPLNLFNKHATGLIFEKGRDNIVTVKYLDSLNQDIPQELKQIIIDDGLGAKINFQQITIEQQKYANCGPEVIENFILYLTGKRVSQEKAIELHSKLVENTLLNIKSSGMHLLFEGLAHHYQHTQDCLEQNTDYNNQCYHEDYDNHRPALLGQYHNDTI
jgi:hypothetical protein